MNPYFIEEAKLRAKLIGLEDRLRFEVKTIDKAALHDKHDVVVCTGAVDIFSGFLEALKALRNVVSLGGQIIIADGYWKRKPTEGFLKEFFDTKEKELYSLPSMLQAVADCGLYAPYVMTSSDSEWEHYEGLWARELECAAQEASHTAEATEMISRAKKSRENYWIHGGRETLGYAALAVKV